VGRPAALALLSDDFRVFLVGRRRALLAQARLPLDANVQFMTLMATKMPYIGRG
jgi:hypothetical protein